LLTITAILATVLPAFSQVKDIDGNSYRITEYQQGTWMMENLKTTKLSDGTPIKMIKDDKEFAEAKVPAFAWYKNDPQLGKKYGGLYNWYAVNTGKLCPTGYHVPNDDEWMILEVWILGMSDEDVSNDGDRGTDQGLKLRHPTEWNEKYAVEPSGFDALPAGLRADDGSFLEGKDGSNMSMHFGTYFWTSTDAERGMAYMRSTGGFDKTILKVPAGYSRGHSVRCVKDLPK
jgi:uncharacterized protein (TIGR02145 family)